MRFLESNLSRGKTILIQVEFLGTVYNTPKESLPWYNTLVWALFVTPVGFLIVAGIGFSRRPEILAKRADWALDRGTLDFLDASAGACRTRQAMMASGFSCRLLACCALLGRLGGPILARSKWGRWAKAAIMAALLEGAVSILVMMPVPLSYFSPLVGGLPGASALGMEPTYYWDALSPEARRWLAEHTATGRNHPVRDVPSLMALSAPRSEHCPSADSRSIAAYRNGTCSKTGQVHFRPSTGSLQQPGPAMHIR